MDVNIIRPFDEAHSLTWGLEINSVFNMMNVKHIHLWGLKMNNISNNIMQCRPKKQITTCNISCKVSTYTISWNM
jgi:hypothetical protein